MPAVTQAAERPLASTKLLRQALLPYSRSPSLASPAANKGASSKRKKLGGSSSPKGQGTPLVEAKLGDAKEDLSDVDSIYFPTTPSERAAFRTQKGKKLSDFQWRLYDAVRSIELGKITTYGILAGLTADEGSKGSARAVGSALRNNPFAPKVPCHRIVNSDLYISGFAGDYGLQASLAPSAITSTHTTLGDTLQARKGTKGGGDKVWKKVEMLAREGVAVDGRGYVVGGEAVIWRG